MGTVRRSPDVGSSRSFHMSFFKPHRCAVWLAIALAACGGGDDVATATPATSTADAPPESVLPTPADAHEAQQQRELLARGVSELVAFIKPQFGLLDVLKGRRLFERETFDGNGRTCLTCHSRDTGTVSPQDAQHRLAKNRHDPLFVGDGSDDGQGNGASRMLKDATVLVRIALPPHVSLADEPQARSVVLRRGIPSTLNTPALDDVLMVDGRERDLLTQAKSAIADHAQAPRVPSASELQQIAAFQHTPAFFSSFPLLRFRFTGVKPTLPEGHTEAEQRGRRFFVDAKPSGDLKTGLCAGCHSGPMLNETNQFVPAPPFDRGGRFQSVGVSEFNDAGNPVRRYLFKNADGTTTELASADPGRALITGDPADSQSRNAFKIPSLWGAARTAPYFHDNSSKTLDDVARHYARFFAAISPIVLTEQDQQDMVAYMKLLR
jgi:hypothetical protein